jgi:geranylgeranyl diphosphate synthase type II
MANAPSNELAIELAPLRTAIEEHLSRFTAPSSGCPERLNAAIRYSVLAPGKRLRPLLCLLACEAVGGDWQAALPAACAIEFIHVYSLIHDDLPAMDNDTLRRGLPCCHIQFDEATAILAGDSLQMLAVQVICQELDPPAASASLRILSEAAGRGKLVGGQQDDLAAEGRFGPVDMSGLEPLEFLKSIHRRKTSALIEASLQMGGVAGGAALDHLRSLSAYGAAIGLAFQIVDDCLDVESTAEQLGKHTRKDSELGKLTYPVLMGVEASRRLAEQLIGEACAAVAVFKDRGERLARLAQFVVDRKV